MVSQIAATETLIGRLLELYAMRLVLEAMYITSENNFFFQAEDGIRDRDVTGVQTFALPI